MQNAVKFLSHPKVRGSPVIYRRSFLEKKGLTKEEIDEAFRRVPVSQLSIVIYANSQFSIFYMVNIYCRTHLQVHRQLLQIKVTNNWCSSGIMDMTRVSQLCA